LFGRLGSQQRVEVGDPRQGVGRPLGQRLGVSRFLGEAVGGVGGRFPGGGELLVELVGRGSGGGQVRPGRDKLLPSLGQTLLGRGESAAEVVPLAAGEGELRGDFAGGLGAQKRLALVDEPQENDTAQRAAEHVHHGQAEDHRDAVPRAHWRGSLLSDVSAKRRRYPGRLTISPRRAGRGSAVARGAATSKWPRGSSLRNQRPARAWAAWAASSAGSGRTDVRSDICGARAAPSPGSRPAACVIHSTSGGAMAGTAVWA
jgi:hypothetical protein